MEKELKLFKFELDSYSSQSKVIVKCVTCSDEFDNDPEIIKTHLKMKHNREVKTWTRDFDIRENLNIITAYTVIREDEE